MAATKRQWARELVSPPSPVGAGTLDRVELQSVVVQMGRDLAELDLDTLFCDVDKDADGVVSFREFEVWFALQDTVSQERMIVRLRVALAVGNLFAV